MALRETLIAVGVSLAIAGAGAGGTYIATVSALGVRIDGHEKMLADLRPEINGMHQRENTLAEGNVTTRYAIDVLTARIDGKLALFDSNIQHIRDTVDEIRGVQKKHPTSLNATAADHQ